MGLLVKTREAKLLCSLSICYILSSFFSLQNFNPLKIDLFQKKNVYEKLIKKNEMMA